MRVPCCLRCENCMAIWGIEENTKSSMGNLRNHHDNPRKLSIFVRITIQTKRSNFAKICSRIPRDIPMDKTFHWLIKHRQYYDKSCSCPRNFLSLLSTKKHVDDAAHASGLIIELPEWFECVCLLVSGHSTAIYRT
jgi:hypothetical protein